LKVHRLVREQLLGGSIDDVFSFFSDVHNLERMTPGWLGFRILGSPPEPLREGAVIDYTIRLAGVPVRWRTRIVDWQPGRLFSDLQERGPYSLWEHTHSFREVAGGVLMRDEVRYALPLGPLGGLAHAVAVRASLGRIFDYRFDVLAGIFPIDDQRGLPAKAR
jgi:ligand-binding SRPBCC domain-containing protein